MTETPARIRWQREDDNSLTGRVGAMAEPVFFIWPPESPGKAHILTSSLPGHTGPGDFYPSGFVADVKAEAERWLEEFVTSLGAIFPAGPPMVCTACRKPVRKMPGTWAPTVWDHADAEDGRACPSLGAHLTGTPIMGMAAETANPAPAGEKE